MDKEQLLGTVKMWIELDDEIKSLQKQLRDKKNIKKQATTNLVETMKSHEIDCFDTEISWFIVKEKLKNHFRKNIY